MRRVDDGPKRATNLTLDAQVLDTTAIGSIPTAELRKPVAHLGAARADVQAALDTLFGPY